MAKLHQFSRKRIGQMCEFLRDVTSAKLLRTPVMLGGPGIIVEIDESLFTHKRKYNRGRVPNDTGERWVFGMVDRSQTPAIGYMELVPRRDAATLLPIIQRHVRPGSIVHSDQWRAYAQISTTLGFTHLTVNHSLNFVDRQTGCHTQAVESYWARMKASLKKQKGILVDKLPAYLDEQMWRAMFRHDPFETIMEHMAEQYPVTDILAERDERIVVDLPEPISNNLTIATFILLLFKKSTSASNGKAVRNNKSASTKQTKENKKLKEQQPSKGSKKKTKQEVAARASGPTKQIKASEEDYQDEEWTTLVSKKDRRQTKLQPQVIAPKEEAAPTENKTKRANKKQNDGTPLKATDVSEGAEVGVNAEEVKDSTSPEGKKKKNKSPKTTKQEQAPLAVEKSRVEDVVVEEAPLGEDDGWIEVKVSSPSPPTTKKKNSPKSRSPPEEKPSEDVPVPSHEPLLEAAEDVVLESAIKEAILESVPPPATKSEESTPTSKSKSKKKKKKKNSPENVDGGEMREATTDVTEDIPPKSDNRSSGTEKEKANGGIDTQDATPAQATPDQGSKTSKKMKQKNKDSSPSLPQGESAPAKTATAPTGAESTPSKTDTANTKADSTTKKNDPAPAGKSSKKQKSQSAKEKAAPPSGAKGTLPSQEGQKEGQPSTTKKGKASSPKPKEESNISPKTDVGGKGDAKVDSSKPMKEETAKVPAKVVKQAVTPTATEVKTAGENQEKTIGNMEEAKPVKKKKKVRRDV